MAHYSIYIPGATGASPESFQRVGLNELQQKQQWTWYQVVDGPDGQGGSVATVVPHRDDSDPLLAYKPELQKWVPIGNRPDLGIEKGAFWYGYEEKRPPRPSDLAHRRLIRGKSVVLNDGNPWHVPETLQMPLDIGRDQETGELTKLYSAEYEKFSKMAEKYVFTMFEHIISLEMQRQLKPELADEEIVTEFSMEDSWNYCCTALSINYRVAEPIIGPNMLHLLDDRKMAYVIMASLAFPDILEVIEKKKITSPVSIPVGLSM